MPLEPDVLIVGSGLIGCLYARKLLDANLGVKILMVDAGEHVGSTGNHKRNSVTMQEDMSRFASKIKSAFVSLSVESTANGAEDKAGGESQTRPIPEAQDLLLSPWSGLPAAVAIREVGGMGTYWACATPEQHPDIERSDIFPNDMWESFYEEARSLFKTTTTLFKSSVRQRLLLDTLSKAYGDRSFTHLPLACERSRECTNGITWTSGATFLDNAADQIGRYRHFELLSEHCCTRLHVNWQSRCVDAAEIKNLGTNETVLIKARKFIICAGAVLTAGLLHNSSINADTGYPALGRYLTEQIVAFCQVVLKPELILNASNIVECNHHKQHHPDDPVGIPFEDPDPQYPWHAQIHRGALGYETQRADIDQRLIVDLRFFTYVAPTSSNRVEFHSGILDAFAMPQPTFHYHIDEGAQRRAHLMMDDMINMAGRLGDFVNCQEPRFLPAGAALHICGTTRAGEQDDGESMVDKFSKVWRLNNLFLGGCGVIPTQSACNPTLTAACFALAGVSKLIEDLKAEES